MSPKTGARLIAAGRMALGAGVLAAPQAVPARWLGRDAVRQPIVVYLARMLGARDVALGLATLVTLEDPDVGPRVQAACAAVDSVDALATLMARRQLPSAGMIATLATAGGAAAAGFYFAHLLAHS
ncbi:MAG TPA: hypothetical protein VN892_00770 [Solirubrobacteraceae bacterium]|nr:hypothetical protein [Solirubrobacteraceae bacterium]